MKRWAEYAELMALFFLQWMAMSMWFVPLSAVLEAPKTISSGEQPRKRAAVARPCAVSSSVRTLVAKAPPELALDARR